MIDKLRIEVGEIMCEVMAKLNNTEEKGVLTVSECPLSIFIQMASKLRGRLEEQTKTKHMTRILEGPTKAEYVTRIMGLFLEVAIEYSTFMDESTKVTVKEAEEIIGYGELPPDDK